MRALDRPQGIRTDQDDVVGIAVGGIALGLGVGGKASANRMAAEFRKFP